MPHHLYDRTFKWFGSKVDGWIFENPDTQQSWKIVKKLRDRITVVPTLPSDVPEAVGVFLCRLVVDKKDGQDILGSEERILKLRMQTPLVFKPEELSSDPLTYADEAIDLATERTRAEFRALEAFTIANCPYTPRLDYVFEWLQGVHCKDLWIRGGFLYGFLMEKVPGVQIARIWHWNALPPASEREAIRQAFRKAMIAIYELGFSSIDWHPSNIFWDASTQTCYFIDMEYYSNASADFRLVWEGDEWKLWGLDEREWMECEGVNITPAPLYMSDDECKE